MAERSTVNSLPKLPGYDFSALSQPASFGKSHGFAVVQGVPMVKSVAPAKVKPATAAALRYSDQAILESHPQWKTLADKVLRFFGYFVEAVSESAVEKVRVRKVVVNYSLQHRTVAINETAAVINSGLRQGSIMSKHNEPSVNLESLRIGQSIHVRGRDINLVDCDGFTREFFASVSAPQPEPMDYPPDEFERLASIPKRVIDQDHIEMKKIIEMQAAAASGHHASTLTPEDRVKAQMFLKHDKEVLNFFATWDKRAFRINFFLTDGTMSVTAIHSANDGRGTQQWFVKRSLIQKGDLLMKSIDTISAVRGVTPQHFTDLDLIVGQSITLYGKTFFLYSCDPFSKAYYRRVHGIEQGELEKPWTEGDPLPNPRAVPQPPPPNGFGTDEDSLGSWKRMVPRAPKKDTAKYIAHANDVLRFRAVLENPPPESGGRQFIVCFYLADDTVSVYETPVRNSGHSGGKIFARAPVKEVTQQDMFVGASLKLAGLRFVLTDVDERTEKYLATGESMDGPPDAAAEELLARARQNLTQRFSRVTDAYRHFNVSKSGMGFGDLKRMLRECEVKVDNDALVAEIMRLVDRDQDGVISLQEFVEHVLRQSLTHKPPMSTDTALSAESYTAAEHERTKREFADNVLKKFVAKLEARRAFIVDTFRIVSDCSVDGLIGADTFRTVVTDRFALNLTQEELDALVFRFYYVDTMTNWESRRLSLREFRKVLDK